jgi:hypothetical protein
LEKQQDRLVEEAKAKMQKKDKKGAMYCLKKKKMVQGQVDSIMGTMITLEQQKMALENAATYVQSKASCMRFLSLDLIYSLFFIDIISTYHRMIRLRIC